MTNRADYEAAVAKQNELAQSRYAETALVLKFRDSLPRFGGTERDFCESLFRAYGRQNGRWTEKQWAIVNEKLAALAKAAA